MVFRNGISRYLTVLLLLKSPLYGASFSGKECVEIGVMHMLRGNCMIFCVKFRKNASFRDSDPRSPVTKLFSKGNGRGRHAKRGFDTLRRGF